MLLAKPTGAAKGANLLPGPDSTVYTIGSKSLDQAGWKIWDCGPWLNWPRPLSGQGGAAAIGCGGRMGKGKSMPEAKAGGEEARGRNPGGPLFLHLRSKAAW